MYTVTMKNAILPGLEVNGDYFVAAAELDPDRFDKDNLAEVTVTDEETGEVETLADAQLIDFHIRKGHTFFCIKEKSERQKAQEQLNSVTAAASIAFVVMAESGNVDEVTATEHLDMFASWAVGVNYGIGALRQYNGKLYKCAQAHTSQKDWTPDVSPALWAVAGDPREEYPAWSQPIGAHDAYLSGDKVTHTNAKWISDVDGNVWEPGVYGWTAVTE